MIQNSAPPDYTGSDKSFYTVQTKKLTNEKKKQRKSSTKTCTPYFAVQKLARFRGYRVNERRIHTVFVHSKICPERCKRGVSVTLYETRNSGLHVDVKWSSFAIGQNT